MVVSAGRRTTTGIAALVVLGTLVACSSEGSGDDAAPADGKVAISISNRPSEQSPDERAVYDAVVADFEAEHPDIDLVPEETSYDPATFAALLAGGTMPTAMDVPFTDTQALIARGQVRDLTEEYEANEALAKVNPQLLTSAQDADGHIYGVPSTAYSMAVVVHRGLFEEAGLDLDQPFADWDELRAAARTITEKTGAAGLGLMTKENQGGWQLTALSYAHGGQLEEQDGDEVTATVDNEGTRQALELVQAMRFEDGTLGDNALMNMGDVQNGIAGDRYAMGIMGSDAYWSLVLSKGFDPELYGLLPMPQDDDGLGTLGGGGYTVVRADATPEEAAAVLEWTAFKFQRFLDEETARADAQASDEAGQPVPQPGIPMVDAATFDQYLQWAGDSVNVPLEHQQSYLDSVDTMPLVPEPPVAAQQVYAALDPVLQAVLTDPDADVDALLADAQDAVSGIVESAAQG